jgi:hypothetical protein
MAPLLHDSKAQWDDMTGPQVFIYLTNHVREHLYGHGVATDAALLQQMGIHGGLDDLQARVNKTDAFLSYSLVVRRQTRNEYNVVKNALISSECPRNIQNIVGRFLRNEPSFSVSDPEKASVKKYVLESGDLRNKYKDDHMRTAWNRTHQEDFNDRDHLMLDAFQATFGRFIKGNTDMSLARYTQLTRPSEMRHCRSL